jgi:hypothetical protein
MGALALDHTYRYAYSSMLAAQDGGAQLRLATCGGAEPHPYFFQGRLTRPKRTADLLSALVQIVQARFHVPTAMLARILAAADPVVTSGGDCLRFEAFSACCSTYARVDLLPQAFRGELRQRGTTNVDFNAAMRSALARIRDADAVELAVGTDTFELARGRESVIERKVALPVRWLKGFVEVQAYQARMRHCLEVSGSEAQRFFRSLPRRAPKHQSWVAPAGRGLRLSQCAARGSVAVGGAARLRLLENLARHARCLRIYAEPETQTSAWELVLDEARFHLVLSPEVWRGFSGEGQALSNLAAKRWQRVLPRVHASLKWETSIDAGALAKRLRLARPDIAAALNALGSRGLVGYDLALGSYFHRELPFDLSRLEALQPRLRDARKLLAGGQIRVVNKGADTIEAFVPGSGVEHRVRLSAAGARCTCPWFAKHQGLRGPCKHVLAVQLLLEPAE